MKLETARRNYNKFGKVYGVSEKDGKAVYQIIFDDWDNAINWYYNEEYDFRIRSFISKRRSEFLEDSGCITWEEEEYYKTK